MVLAHNIEDVQRTTDVRTSHDTTFDTMMLSSSMLHGLTSAGFYKPSPIQLIGIPLGKLGLDLMLEAKSGTGKTVVFCTVALEKLKLNKGLQVIMITPTREIAAQISDVLKQIGSKYEELAVEVVIGGLPFQDDVQKLNKKVHILVGTPGRLKYLIKDKHIDTSAIRLLVLDEADKLMEKSFLDDIRYIHSALPEQKQVILSSATFSDSVLDVISDLVEDAHHVCPNNSNVLLGVSHKITYVKFNSNSVRQTEIRFNELNKLLTEIQFKQCVVFCNYQARVTQLHKMLTKAKWPSELVYGKQDQIVRLQALKTLQEYKCRILIATDLVSRGIDAKNIDLVINFEPPENCETYLHRIGRSGRYGSIGMAVSIVCEGVELMNFNKILEPIVQSINLQHFWTGEKLDNQSDIHKNNKPITKNSLCDLDSTLDCNSNCVNLWQILVSSNTTAGNIESFDQLCDSYKDNNENLTKIESFSELLEDYTNTDSIGMDEGDDRSSYKHMEFKNLNYKDYIESVRKLKEKLDENTICSDARFTYDGQSKKTKEGVISEIDKIDVKKLNGDISEEEKFSQLTINTLNNKRFIDANEFMLEIPQCFITKSKRKIKHDKPKHPIYNKPKHKNRLFHHPNKIQSNVESHECYTIAKERNTNSISNNVPIDEKQFKSPCGKEYNKKALSTCLEDDTHINVKDKVEVYNQWYNQLKIRMKQIEQILYFEEMSKY